MMIRNLLLLTTCFWGVIQATQEKKEDKAGSNISYEKSSFISPILGSKSTNTLPVIMGILKDKENKPIKDEKVLIYVDRRAAGIVKTNKDGLWAYRLNKSQKLKIGSHIVSAITKTGLSLKETAFIIQHKDSQIYRSGNVDVNTSYISYPAQGSYIGDNRPGIVGLVFDSSYNPVIGETLNVYIDDVFVGSGVSDSNGIWQYWLTAPQALSEGVHTVRAHAVETNVDLNSNTFTIDTVAPSAPVITSPANLSVVTTNPVAVVGTGEVDATVYITFDTTSQEFAWVDSNGDWSVNISFDNGPHTINAYQQDLAYNNSPTSPNRTFTVLA